MDDLEGKSFKAQLVTRGRNTRRYHTVWLLGVMYSGDVYFSRHKKNSDWILNAIKNDMVKIIINHNTFNGTAHLVTDDKLSAKISNLKYPGQLRAREKRVTLKVIIKRCEL